MKKEDNQSDSNFGQTEENIIIMEKKTQESRKSYSYLNMTDKIEILQILEYIR